MQTLFIANCCFEEEIKTKEDFSSLILRSCLYRQLQFLSYLYAPQEALIYTCDLPPPSYLHALEQLLGQCGQVYTEKDFNTPSQIDCWGKSPNIFRFAKVHNIPFSCLDWNMLETINSKVFSFSLFPHLPQTTLLTHFQEAKQWLEAQHDPFVLKTALGFSGKGHFVQEKTQELTRAFAFCQKAFAENEILIAEPWLMRLYDFSTQWIIEEDQICYLGATRCENDKSGKYRGSQIASETLLFGSDLDALLEHKEVAQKALVALQKKGFTGNVGIDAFVYESSGKKKLYPIVEINPRKTMGFVALKLYEKLQFPKTLHLKICNSKGTAPLLLPQAVHGLEFAKNLTFTFS